jgi:endonuclease YncB( thermonuclease family)
VRLLRKIVLALLLCGLFTAWIVTDIRGEMRTASGDTIIVRDGDTLKIAGLDHRLHGIDAPEYQQVCKDAGGKDWPCGMAARTALVDLLKGKTLTCEERARDKYSRVVATCVDAQGRDIARTLAAQGMAISMDGFSEGPYATEVELARARKLGIWQGSFDPPATWRESHAR